MSSRARILYRTLVSSLLLILVPCAESQFDLITSTTEHNSNTFARPPAVNCGETDKMVDTCFKDLPPPLMEFLLTTKIAVDKNEISSKCTWRTEGQLNLLNQRHDGACYSLKPRAVMNTNLCKQFHLLLNNSVCYNRLEDNSLTAMSLFLSTSRVFKQGMKCFDRYSERCLSQDKVQLYENNVAGAKRFISKFCEDRKFQADYLRHKDCFYHIQDDWNRCSRDFQHILSDELHGRSHSRNTTGKYMQFCCSRYAYENCIYNSARYKCYKNSAKFARDAARMLADEKHFSNCNQFENLLCAATEIDVRQNLLLLLLTLVAVTWKCSEVWWKLRF